MCQTGAKLTLITGITLVNHRNSPYNTSNSNNPNNHNNSNNLSDPDNNKIIQKYPNNYDSNKTLTTRLQ